MHRKYSTLSGSYKYLKVIIILVEERSVVSKLKIIFLVYLKLNNNTKNIWLQKKINGNVLLVVYVKDACVLKFDIWHLPDMTSKSYMNKSCSVSPWRSNGSLYFELEYNSYGHSRSTSEISVLNLNYQFGIIRW